MTGLIQVITAGISSLCFAVLFNVRGIKLLVTAIGGMLAWLIYLGLNLFIKNIALQYFLVTVFITVYTEIAARIFKTPTTTFLVAAIIIMIPGGSLYNAMSCAIQGLWKEFAYYAVNTARLSAAIAIGIMAVSSVVKIIYALCYKKGALCSKTPK